MKNLIAELLIRLAQKEQESKTLVAQVEALEMVVTALLRKMDGKQLQQINDCISDTMLTASSAVKSEHGEEWILRENYIQRLLNQPRH